MWEDVYEIMIGTQAGGVAGMVKVSELGIPKVAKGAFTIDPAHRPVVIRTGSGSEVIQGWLQAGWHVNFLHDSQHEALTAFKSGTTTMIYVRTLSEDSKTWKNYLAKSLWPPKPVRTDPTAIEHGIIVDFAIRFIQMIEQV